MPGKGLEPLHLAAADFESLQRPCETRASRPESCKFSNLTYLALLGFTGTYRTFCSKTAAKIGSAAAIVRQVDGSKWATRNAGHILKTSMCWCLTDSHMERLLTAEMLCIAIGFKLQTIYNRLCNGGDLPPVIRLGRSLRWREADVDAWIRSRSEAGHLCLAQAIPLKKRRGAPTKAERVAARTHARSS